MSAFEIDFIGILSSLFVALWIMLPAYVPNSAAAVFGGGSPIDSGKKWSDERRIFGDGKTWRGLFGGVFSGIFVGIILILIGNYAGIYIHTLLSVVLLATGALLGDLVKSFFKRRLNKKRGDEWLIADQYDLVAGSLLCVFIFDSGWVFANINLAVFLWIIIITPLLHRGANIIGYIIGVKEVPW